MQRILVTGSRGFVGSRIVAELARQGRTVLAFEGDLRDPDSFEPHDERQVDVVIHAAALITHRGDVGADAYWQVNVEGTRNLLHFYPRQKFVYVSTTDVLRADLSGYAKSKQAAEALVRTRHPHSIVRLASVFGPGQTQTTKLIPKLLSHYALGGPPVELTQDVRSYCFVDRAAAAIVAAIAQEGTSTAPSVQISNADLRALIEGLFHHCDPPELPAPFAQFRGDLRTMAEAMTAAKAPVPRAAS